MFARIKIKFKSDKKEIKTNKSSEAPGMSYLTSSCHGLSGRGARTCE
jgi:hypothetical protein